MLVAGSLLMPSTGFGERGRKAPADTEASESKTTWPTIAHHTEGFDTREGFLTFHLDPESGRVWLEVPPPREDDGLAQELIYLEGLVTGLGSNPVGLDRGQISSSRLMHLRRIGPRVFLEEPNLRFRALDADPSEALATRESFATSIVWGKDIAAIDPDGRALVDFTSFIVRDAHDVSKTLRENQQGSFSLDTSRSLVDPASCFAFPDNIELEAILTYGGSDAGDHVKSTAPNPTAITLVQHHSFVRLPEPGYEPREFDPRIGLYGIRFLDYAAPLDEDIERRWVMRHRLEKTDPTAERSTVKEPIVYYVDSGAPEPVRGALLDGARWWTEAFEKAGFIDAFRVEVLPPDVHPLDVRYNVIQWVHRSTRGWSYGTSLADPRTGEILKGHVNLGSLRVRQDRRIFEGLLGTAKTGSGADDDPIQLSLARLRQLSAHEVGHTLGITHNFAASTYGGRASVMDYPAPWVTVDDDGELDVSKAYGVGLGAWDIHTVRYGYSQFLPGTDTTAALEAIAQEGIEANWLFLGDEDARPPGASDPRGNLWDNGEDAVDALEEALAVRRIALSRFGLDNLPAGRPVAELEEVLAPIYFYHRYQLEAATKVVGGLEYQHAIQGDGQPATQKVSAERQHRALEVILGLLDPQALDLPESLLERMLPRPFDTQRNREMFANGTSPAFDALGAAATAADQAVAGLLVPERLARVYDFHRRDPGMPSVTDILQALVDKAFGTAGSSGESRHQALRHVVQRVVVDRLIDLAQRTGQPQISALAEDFLTVQLAPAVTAGVQAGSVGGVEGRGLLHELRRFLERREETYRYFVAPAEPPPGSPIGTGGDGHGHAWGACW